MNETVSVIIPVYNSQNTFAATLDSVLAQDYPALEITVIDDGSTDDTVQSIRQQYGERIQLLQQTNAGAAAARNRGIAAASGRYIAFLDADDLWLPWKISTQMRYLRAHPDIGLVYNRWQVIQGIATNASDILTAIPRPAHPPIIVATGSGDLYTRLLMESVIHTSAALFRREVIEQIGTFDTRLRRGQDYDYWLRASQLTDIAQLDCILSTYHIHTDSATHQRLPINYEMQVLKKTLARWGTRSRHGDSISNTALQTRLTRSWQGFVWSQYHSGCYTAARQGAWQLIRHQPLAYQGWLYLIASSLKQLVQCIRLR